MLQWGAWGGFGFADFLNQLESVGFFRYLLPFLLIFAVVYAILGEIPTFEKKKGPAVIIALALGLLSLQFDYVPAFFQAIFPNFGIGLSILLVALILAGAFIASIGDNDERGKTYRWIFFGLGGLIFLIVTISSLSDVSFIGSNWWSMYGGLAIVLVIIGGVIVAVILGSRGENNNPPAGHG